VLSYKTKHIRKNRAFRVNSKNKRKRKRETDKLEKMKATEINSMWRKLEGKEGGRWQEVGRG
jgi:hypothetical protein